MNNELILFGKILAKDEKDSDIISINPAWFYDDELRKGLIYIQNCIKKQEEWDYISVCVPSVKKSEALEGASYGLFSKRKKILIQDYKDRKKEVILQSKKDSQIIINELQKLQMVGNEGENVNVCKNVIAKSFEEASIREVGKLLGSSTGFKYLDKIMLGQVPSKFVVIGGYNNHGKTTLAMNFVVSALKEKEKCVFFSLEMGEVEIVNKAMSIYSDIPTRKFMYKDFQEEVASVYDNCMDWDMLIYNDLTDIDLIIARIKDLKKEGYKNFYIDYLQNLKSKGLNERREILEYASGQLQICALQENVFICGLSQVGEAAFQDTSGKSGLKGSGDISASSDVTIKVIRNVQKGIKDNNFGILVSKHRYGRTCLVECIINEETGKIRQIC